MRWILALACIGVCALGLWIARRRSPLDPLVLALGCTALVGSFYPIATAFVTPLTWRGVQHLPEESVVETARCYLGFAVGLVLALVASRRAAPRPGASGSAPPSARVAWRDRCVAWGLFAAGSALYCVYVARVGLGALLSRHDFAEKYLESAGLGPWLFGLNLVVCACLWAEGGALGRSERALFRAVGLAVALWALAFIAVRTYAVALALGYACIHFHRSGFALRALRVRWVALALVGLVAVEGFSILRGVWRGSLGEAVAALGGVETEIALGRMIGGSELAHPFMTAMELVRYERAGELAGSSVRDAALVVLPLAVVAERPKTLSQTFVERYYPDVAARGGGTALSLVGEAWWNFGPTWGPLLFGLAVGLVACRLGSRARVAPHGVVARVLPYVAYLTLLLHRSPIAVTAKQAVSLLVPIVALCVVAQLTWSALASRPRRRALGVGGTPA